MKSSAPVIASLMMREPCEPPKMSRRLRSSLVGCRLSAGIEKFFADRVAGDDARRCVSAEERLLRNAIAAAVDEAREDAIRETGKRVRFVNERRNAAQLRGEQHRPRGVAADAEDDVRAMAADESATPERNRAAGGRGSSIESPTPLPFSPPTEMNSSGKPAFGTIVFSRPRSVPTKTTRRVASRAIALLRDGDGGIDVSPRPAARRSSMSPTPVSPIR